MKILIIEDEILIAKSLAKMLSLRGHDVETTPLGQEGIELVFNNDYNRVICDLMLQDISGFNVLEEAKKKYSNSEIKRMFIIMTAYNSAETLEKVKAYECLFLQKPFSDLRNTLTLIEGDDYAKE